MDTTAADGKRSWLAGLSHFISEPIYAYARNGIGSAHITSSHQGIWPDYALLCHAVRRVLAC